jgi:hypothetical protein
MKVSKSLPVFLSVVLPWTSISCSSKRNPGIIITTLGAAATALGVASTFYHCSEDPDDGYPGEESSCKAGNPEYGYAVAGVGLLVAALGVYLLVTLRDDYEDEEVTQWPDSVPEIPEIRGQDRL